MVRHAAVALACLALAHAIAAPAAFCPKVLEPLDRDSDECPDELLGGHLPKHVQGMQGRLLVGSLGEALSTIQEESQKAER